MSARAHLRESPSVSGAAPGPCARRSPTAAGGSSPASRTGRRAARQRSSHVDVVLSILCHSRVPAASHQLSLHGCDTYKTLVYTLSTRQSLPRCYYGLWALPDTVIQVKSKHPPTHTSKHVTKSTAGRCDFAIMFVSKVCKCVVCAGRGVCLCAVMHVPDGFLPLLSRKRHGAPEIRPESGNESIDGTRQALTSTCADGYVPAARSITCICMFRKCKCHVHGDGDWVS